MPKTDLFAYRSLILLYLLFWGLPHLLGQENVLTRDFVEKHLQNYPPSGQTEELWMIYREAIRTRKLAEVTDFFKQLVTQPPDFLALEVRSEGYRILADAARRSKQPQKFDMVRHYIEASISILGNRISECEEISYRYYIAQHYADDVPPKYEAAVLYYEDLIEQAREQGCTEQYVMGYSRIASEVFERQGRLVKSLMYRNMCVDLADSLDLSLEARGTLHAKLAILHYHMKNYLPALTHFEKSVEFFEKGAVVGDLTISSHNSMALCYREMGEYQQALRVFQAAREKAIRQQNDTWIGIIEGNIGDVYYFQGDYELAEPHLREDAKTSHVGWEYLNEARSLNRLARVFIAQSKLDSALLLLDSATHIIDYEAREYRYASFPKNVVEVRMENLDVRRIYSMELEQYEHALDYAERWRQLNDSIANIERRQNLAWIEAGLLIDKKNKENLALRSEVQSRDNYLMVSLLIIVLLILTIFFARRFFRARLEAKKAVEKRLEAEKREEQERVQRLESEKQAQFMQQARLSEEIASKERALSTQIHQIIDKNELLQEILTLLEAGKQEKFASLLKKVRSRIEDSQQQEKDWASYKEAFERVHPGFFQALLTKYPQLTQNDLRYAAYVKMGLSSKEIASLMNVKPDSLKNTRYRMRKKMNLDSDIRVNELLMRFQG